MRSGRMDDQQRAAFDAHRDFSGKAVVSACYAPFTSMYLDPLGNALACCDNTDHPLGNIVDTPLLEIWRGPRARALRTALRDYDLGVGCKFCAWQIEDANYESTLTEAFAHLDVVEAEPPWPTRLEFAMSNTCNLECAMCNGNWSSRIRTRREGRPPLPKVYGDAFFEQLRPFVHHLSEARFLGGEPLLATETLRVLELIVDEGLEVRCDVTTNGTQWNDRVERILGLLPVSLAVSLDGVTRETIERIRVGASYDELMANLGRYREYTRRAGSSLSLTFCFMQQNWHEFADYLRFAEDWGCRVFVNTVVNPAFSPFQLPADDFDGIVRSLEAEDDRLRDELTLNRDLWIAELDRLRSWQARARARAADPTEVAVGAPTGAGDRAAYFQPGPLPPALRDAPAATTGSSEAEAIALVRAGMEDAELSVVRCDAADRVVGVGRSGGGGDEHFMGVTAPECLALRWDELAGRLGRVHGNEVNLVREDLVHGGVLRFVVLGQPRVRATYVQLFSYPEHTPDGLAGSVTVAAWSHRPPAWSRRPAAPAPSS